MTSSTRLCSTLMLAPLSSRHERPLAQTVLSLESTTLGLMACFSCHGSSVSSACPHPYDDVSYSQSVPDVPNAASDSLDTMPVLKLSSYLSPQRKQLQGCQRRAATSNRRSRIHRQVAMYHCPHRTARCTFVSSGRSSRIQVWDIANPMDGEHLQQSHPRTTPESGTARFVRCR